MRESLHSNDCPLLPVSGLPAGRVSGPELAAARKLPAGRRQPLLEAILHPLSQVSPTISPPIPKLLPMIS